MILYLSFDFHDIPQLFFIFQEPLGKIEKKPSGSWLATPDRYDRGFVTR